MYIDKPYYEKEFLIRIAEGDEDAFAVFFQGNYPRLRPFVARFFTASDQAEDAIQEVFIRVWLNRDRLPSVENIGGWLRTITARVCMNALRKEVTRSRHSRGISLQGQIEPATPAEKTEASEINRLVSIAINNMPPQRKQIYLLSRSEGMKPAEIADHLSLSVNTVRNVLVVALKEIREFLVAHGHIISLFYLLGKLS